MTRKILIASILGIACVTVYGGWRLVRAGHSRVTRHGPGVFSKTVAGLNIRLVAVAEPHSGVSSRLADHAWTPDGVPYDGPESRLAQNNSSFAPGEGTRRRIQFELEPPKTPEVASPPPATLETPVDVFAYLPDAGSPKDDQTENPAAVGPFKVLLWHGVPRDSSGKVVTSPPTSVGMEFGLRNTDPQPVAFGVDQGEYKVIAKGPASVAGLAEGETSVLASGPWGRIEATHLPRPQFESKPAATHRFRLLGGTFPPNTERRALFYDSKGGLLTSCGDGPNNAASWWGQFRPVGMPTDIASYEIQERPYEFVRFNDISFEVPEVKAYSGDQGSDHAVASPIGKVVGVLKTTRDGAWTGAVLYAADGTRWLDPGQALASYEYGQFDPWDHPLDDRMMILFEPSQGFLAQDPPTMCEVYAADSAHGPRKERLTSWNEQPFQSPTTMIGFGLTTRPYLHLDVRVGDGTWRTLETVIVTDRLLHSAETVLLGFRVLEVFLDNDGSIRIWEDEPDPVTSKSRWRPGEQRLRVIANLRKGGTTEANINMGGTSGSPPNEKGYRGLEYSRQTNGTRVQSGAKWIDLKDVASFEIQVQDLKPSVTIAIHSPKD